jgi:septum formation protein
MAARANAGDRRAPLVLASASPRRRWLLAQLGVAFDVVPVDLDERPHVGEEPATFAQRMADEKAAAASRLRPEAWILAADTVVALDGAPLGKPRDAEEAARMLGALAGRGHVVHTGASLLRPGGLAGDRAVTSTRVGFRALAPEEIRAYVATGEPFDRAGAYAIQGEGAHVVDYVEGSYTNVIGLPLPAIAGWLRAWRLL